ncbi:MAG TPA: hypothetical protein VM711_02230 [Sphingomicrobium sp.]|nr:hypothetical protein [Sphingomicrobium sp.]
MAFQDLVGWLAAALVLATFSARSMVPLRAIAVSSNVAFVAYASMAGLWPVLLLHVVMLPLNVARLRQEIGAHVRANPAAPAGTPCTASRRMITRKAAKSQK